MPDPRVDGSPKGRAARIVGCALDKPGEAARPGRAFDKFPFGLLTLIVSLEAIFLSTFVMISQNREAQRSEIRAQLDFETNVLGEVWTERMAAAKARQSAAETGGGALTGDPTLDTEYVHSGVLGAPQQHPSGS